MSEDNHAQRFLLGWMMGLLCSSQCVCGGKELLLTAVLESFLRRTWFAQDRHVPLMHSVVRSCGETMNKEHIGGYCEQGQ